jgi:spermidine synthase
MIYLLFFLSGAAALVYQVVWVRSLTLVFGGSHLAVTVVLSVFMAGLAAGGYLAGRIVDRVARPLILYAQLEIGIAASALVFAGLLQLYPAIYGVLAAGRDHAAAYLTLVRILFAAAALLVPTTLMGATLPVLSRFVAGRPDALGGRLSFLYGVNTLGAVAGVVLAGFVLLRFFAVSTTLSIAVAANVAIASASLLLQRRTDRRAALSPAGAPADGTAEPAGVEAAGPAVPVTAEDRRLARLVLVGIGISGFCALGYEVLWTRVLAIAVGASVYGFTTILAAFLTGIALGSKAWGVLVRLLRMPAPRTSTVVLWFGATQMAIGATALLVTIFLRDVPANGVRLQTFFAESGLPSFGERIWTSVALSFLYTLVPAFFMGAAFPIAGEAVARCRGLVGRAVGDVIASNTVGAILGAAVSGLLLIRIAGIERSLQILTVINLGAGGFILASLGPRPPIRAAAGALSVAALSFLLVNQEAARVWDRNYFAIFRSNQPEAFRTPEMIREAVENTDVLFYAEGAESIVSVIRVKGGEQAFITNGRVEASSHLQARQVQFTLGHLPMLLHRDPKQVLVVGMGSGMTAGATSVHPGAERVTVVEIEPRVLGAARTFEAYNHRILDSPRLELIVNDGRNFLMTTDRMFDVITADPIHPWFRGAGYLYSSQYFELAAAHLRPGGVIAQWLPLYELTPADLASIVRTVRAHFPHTLLWLTHYDSVIVASREPFVIDEDALDRRIAEPGIIDDLRAVMMGSAADLLSYGMMGNEGMARFAERGVLNTDDRLYLEFSAPFSIARPAVMAENIMALSAHRESLRRYLAPAADPAGREAQRQRTEAQLAAARVGDPALAHFLEGGPADPQFLVGLRRVSLEHPWYAPGAFLRREYQAAVALEPRLIHRSSLPLMSDAGGPIPFEIAAVLVPVSPARASVMFVDNDARVVYGQAYLDDYQMDGRADRFAIEVMGAVRAAYENELRSAAASGRRLPPADHTLERIRSVIGMKVQRVQPGS